MLMLFTHAPALSPQSDVLPHVYAMHHAPPERDTLNFIHRPACAQALAQSCLQ